jgi:hypothetical protein
MNTITSVTFKPETFGITQKSLMALRNFLLSVSDRRIKIVMVPTGDITCGFLLIDKEWECAYWSGDGFRTDGGGEGGRGYKAAERLINALGMSFDHDDEVVFLDHQDESMIRGVLMERASKFCSEEYEGDFVRMSELNPKY